MESVYVYSIRVLNEVWTRQGNNVTQLQGGGVRFFLITSNSIIVQMILNCTMCRAGRKSVPLRHADAKETSMADTKFLTSAVDGGEW
jgi:hypothetical protein